MNKIIVIGHLGRDPEMKYTPNGQGVTSFSVASSRKYTTSAGEQREGCDCIVGEGEIQKPPVRQPGVCCYEDQHPSAVGCARV